MVDGDEGYATAGLSKDGSIWARMTWIGAKKTVTLVTTTGTPPDSMHGRHAVRTLVLSARDVSSRDAAKDTAR